MKLGICAYPLSKSKETGRGLDKLVEEVCQHFDRENISYDFYEKGIITNEIKAICLGILYLFGLQKTQNDCYLATYPVSAIFPSLLRKRPLVTLIHDLIPFSVYGYDNAIKYKIKRYCLGYSVGKCDAIIVPFVSTKEKLQKMYGISSDKVFVVPYGIDHDTYFPDSKTIKIRHRIAFLGEIKKAKGIDTVIYSFAEIVKHIPDATLAIGSGGREMEEMKQLAEKILPKNSYEFLGFVAEDDMRAFYNSAEVFVFPSRYGFGLSSLEAMACGVPTFVGRTLDSLDFNYNSEMLVDPDNPSELASKIIATLQSRQVLAQKSQEAIQVAQQFSWENMARKYYEICQKTYQKY